MEMFRTALALLCTKDVTPADWAGLVGAEPADIAADLRAGGPLLAHLLGKRVGPTDWRRVAGHQVYVLVNNAGSGREWPAALPRETRKRRQTRWLACHAARRRATGGLFKDRKQIE
jgi:hypothetical protein